MQIVADLVILSWRFKYEPGTWMTKAVFLLLSQCFSPFPPLLLSLCLDFLILPFNDYSYNTKVTELWFKKKKYVVKKMYVKEKYAVLHVTVLLQWLCGQWQGVQNRGCSTTRWSVCILPCVCDLNNKNGCTLLKLSSCVNLCMVRQAYR